jgi:polar amino acid transport system permease protein
MHYSFLFGQVLANLPYLLGGAGLTITIALVSFWAGMVIGLFGAAGKTFGGPGLRALVGAYVQFFTNTPLLIQIFFLLYALPEIGVLLSPLSAVLIGKTLCAGAYLTEIQRAGFLSVRRTELEAAEALGMSRLQTVYYVIAPHIAKTLYAPLSNYFIWALLGTSLAAVFGVEELTGRAINVSTATLRTIETFLIVAAIYVIITAFASALLALVGRYCFGVRARIF